MAKKNQDAETNATYSAETHFESEMPTRNFTAIEAETWLTNVCENEDLDPIKISRQKLPSNIEGLAVFDDWCIKVPTNKVSQHTLLHELAHFSCANRGHGREFRTRLVALHRRYTSLAHAAALHQIFVASGLSVDPLIATS
ncbi:hypothetical protein EMGBS4_18800 [Acidimicrobiaceae bacterium]|nr:hypothetical protein EMGBS4_18800 [Acidimicrobiaceae bacterium]